MRLLDRLPDQSWKAVSDAAQADEVEGYLVDELAKALGLRADSHWRGWLRPIFVPLVRGFARQAAAFDQSVARYGFQHTAREWLKKWIPGLQVNGREQLPGNGPLIIAANHPGTFDGLAIASQVERQDLKIITAANPFFRALPNTRKHFIYSTLDVHVRMATLRNALRHLQNGGVLLIFPSGKLDPDPLYFQQAAVKALTRWSASLELLLRKVPQVSLVIAINSGFVAPEYLHNPLVRLRPDNVERQKLAEFIQVIQQVVFNRQIYHQPSITFATPTYNLSQNTGSIHAQVIASAAQLVDRICSGGIGQFPSGARQTT